jgi:hypothetical protein
VSRISVLNQARPAGVIVNGSAENAFFQCLKRSGALLFILFVCLAFLLEEKTAFAQHAITDENPLSLPDVGDYGLRIVAPNIVELTLISSKEPAPARVSAWDFVGDNFVPNLPPASEFSVSENGQPISVVAVGFNRRALSGPE